MLLLLWNALCTLWASVTGRPLPTEKGKEKAPAAVEEAETDEKESSEDEVSSSDKGSLHLRMTPPTSTPTSIPSSPQLQNPAIVSIKRQLHRTVSEPPIPPDTATPPTTTPPGTGTQTPSQLKKTPFRLLPKTLVLDLDETLIHSTSRPMLYPGSARSGLLELIGLGKKNKGAGHTVEVILGGRRTLYHVYKRPFVDYFLRKVRVGY
jgi:CTD nuclear envelope phosphatase 1